MLTKKVNNLSYYEIYKFRQTIKETFKTKYFQQELNSVGPMMIERVNEQLIYMYSKNKFKKNILIIRVTTGNSNDAISFYTDRKNIMLGKFGVNFGLFWD